MPERKIDDKQKSIQKKKERKTFTSEYLYVKRGTHKHSNENKIF